MNKRDQGQKLSHEETQEFHQLRLALKDQSDRVMEALAAMLPEEKRGKWNGERPF